MKFSSIIVIATTVFFILNIFTLNIYATAIQTNLEIECANFLKINGVIKGYPDGSLRLSNNLTRAEFTTLAIRMANYDKTTNVKNYNISFCDVKSSHWAYNNLKIAFKNNIIIGYTDGSFKPDNYISYAESLSIILNILGYGSNIEGTWPNNVITKSDSLGITKNFNLPPDKKITRGEICIALYNALTVNFP